jgi:hypothetical protein
VYEDPAHALFAEELSVIATRELRAPRQDGALLAEPPLEAVGGLLDRNRQILDGIDILGQPLGELRHQARESAVAAAREYLQNNGEAVPAYGDISLILAGHQPELFHPGVWVKNFVLNGLARQHGITPVNLVVDDDTVKSASLRLHALYNGIVRDYRRQNGIRSRNHPVPDLQKDGDWLEAPFWAWHPGQERRGRLFARKTATAIDLRVGGETWPALPLTGLVNAWQARPTAWKVRTRAMTTTLFARLFLGDLFIHGIGGAKYDELTDELIRRFYGLEPPGFLVLSGTWLLPLQRFPATAADCRRLQQHLRDVEWNPQRHLSREAPAEARAWAEEKQRWIAEPEGNRRYRQERYRALRSLTEKLRPFLSEREESLHRDLAACEWQLRQSAVLGRRDYSFCLYPEAMLRRLFQRFLC